MCQEDIAENIRCPTNNKNKDRIVTTYNDAAFLLREFFSIGQLPETFHPALTTLFRCSDLPDAFLQNEAKWHGTCKSKITQSKLDKCKTSLKRKTDKTSESPVEAKITRSHAVKFDHRSCFIPGCTTETSEEEPLHDVMSEELDERFR